MIPPDSFEHYLASLRLSVRPEETEAFVKFADNQFADKTS